MEAKKEAARENNRTISDKEVLDLKVMSISKVDWGALFSKKYKKRGFLAVARQKEDTNQT